MRIRALNHSTYQHQYHIVWGTKYRRKFLKEYVKPEGYTANNYVRILMKRKETPPEKRLPLGSLFERGEDVIVLDSYITILKNIVVCQYVVR